MAKNNNLTDFLTNTAEAIRTAEASTAAIDPQDFEAKIKALSSQDADAAAGHILSGKTAYVKSKKVTGTIPTKTSSNLTASGATVKVPAGYYAAEASKSVATATRAGTTISVTADDTNDTLKFDASNNQSTGYVTGANKTATTTVTLTASGATVTATETGGKKVSKSVSTVGRADTTLTSSKNTTNNTLDFTASNNQGTGYVTGANKTATKSVSLSASGATVTATDGTNSISKSVASGSISASGTASATTTVAPGTVTIANKTASVSGKTQIAASPTTATSGISTYYMAVDATAAANSTGATSNISGTATAKVDTAGYVSSDAEGNVTGTATAKTSAKSSSTYYIPVASGGCTVSGGGLTAGAGAVSASGTNITLTEVSSQPASGYYITAQGSGSVSRAAITDTHTAGYIPAKSATNVSAATSKSSNTATKYYTLPSGSYDASGGGLTAGAGSVAASSSNMTLTESSSAPSSGYYFTATGSGSVSRAAITKSATGGVVSTGSGTVSNATSASSNTATKYYSVPTGGCTVAGGGLSVTTNYSGTPTVDITLDGQTTSGAAITDTKPSSGYYLTVGATSSKLTGSTKVTRAAVTDTHTAGYIPAKSATTVISSTTSSPSVTVNAGSKTEYITLPTGGCTVSGGGLSGGSAVTPTVSLSNGSDTNMSNITIGSKNTSTYPYYFKVSGSSSSGSSTVSRAAVKDTHTAGYIPAKSSTTVISSDSKTVTVNAGSGSSYVGLKGASLSASGSATINPTVEPGKISIDTLTADEHTAAYGQYSGTSTLITPSIVDDPDAITFPYVIALKPEVAAGSASINSSGTASASVSTAGYAPTNLTGSGSVSVSGTATSTAKTGDPYYIPLWGATPNQNASLSLVNSGSTALDVDVTIPQDGYIKAGTKSLSADLRDLPGGENLMASNIKKGVNILGFTGTLEGPSNFIPYSPELTRESSDYAGGTVTYRFQETDDGWWESSNQKVKSSYSLGRFSFDVYETCNVTFEVINYAESNYDYAIFSNLGLNGGAYFSANASADTSNVYKNFKGLSSSSIQELTYNNVTPGRYTVAVKFIKDSSGDNYNDSVKFRLKRPTPNSELLPQVESLEPTYQGCGTSDPSSKYVVNYSSGSNYLNIYRNVEKGGWVQDNTRFFGYDNIYLDRIDNSGLTPENIVNGKTIFGVTGTGGLPVTEYITLAPGETKVLHIDDAYPGRRFTFYKEDINAAGYYSLADISTDFSTCLFSVTAENSTRSESGFIVQYYESNGVITKFAYYRVKIE
jgi:hypothetical protein